MTSTAPPSYEMTISEMLSDPLVKAVMKADGIDPAALQAELRSIAQTITALRRAESQNRGR